MPSCSNGDVVLVRYPFSDLSSSKVRPAVVVSAPHTSSDYFIVPLSSRVANLQAGEFLLQDWTTAGLNVATVAKRGIATVHRDLVLKRVGRISDGDHDRLKRSLREWLALN